MKRWIKKLKIKVLLEICPHFEDYTRIYRCMYLNKERKFVPPPMWEYACIADAIWNKLIANPLHYVLHKARELFRLPYTLYLKHWAKKNNLFFDEEGDFLFDSPIDPEYEDKEFNEILEEEKKKLVEKKKSRS